MVVGRTVSGSFDSVTHDETVLHFAQDDRALQGVKKSKSEIQGFFAALRMTCFFAGAVKKSQALRRTPFFEQKTYGGCICRHAPGFGAEEAGGVGFECQVELAAGGLNEGAFDLVFEAGGCGEMGVTD